MLVDGVDQADKGGAFVQRKEAALIWFTLADGSSIAVAPEHVRYVRPTEGGQAVIYFSRDDRFTIAQAPTEVVARLNEGRRPARRAASGAAPKG